MLAAKFFEPVKAIFLCETHQSHIAEPWAVKYGIGIEGEILTSHSSYEEMHRSPVPGN